MNWKASLTGALLVAICGVAAGVAVDGKSKTTTRTITVTTPAQTISNAGAAESPATTASSTTAPGATSTSTTSGTTATGTTTASTTAEAPQEGQEYLAEYLAGQGAEKLNADASNVDMSSEAGKEELQGQTYQQAVAFTISNGCCASSATFQMPTPGFSRLTSKAIGLETIANAEAFYKLTVYKNNDSSPNSTALYSATFHGPSEIHKMDFALDGATDLVFIWTKESSEPDGQDVFILADPVLSR